ncbi:MAG TPA: GAF domain-containing protein [Mariprofundaceae bacterium]|nr:GAF domain-containing protein [Mariprofundaceae bacterium]
MEHTKLEKQLVQQQYQLAQAVISLAEGKALKPILQHVGELAMELTGAHYAMLAYIIDGRKIYIPLGLTEQQLAQLEKEPQGIGLLGLMWNNHEVVRINNIGQHPKTAGFPAHHPVMTTFLGAPIMFDDEIQGVIYLTDKEGGRAFDPLDETIVRTLASACAIAISNANHIEALEARNAELERLLAEHRTPTG